MIHAMLGKKQSQTQKFLQNGRRIPVTEIAVGDNYIVQIKTLDKDTYSAVQIGFGNRKNANKPLSGHSTKAGLSMVPRILREIRMADGAELPNVGDSLVVDQVFKPGDIVDVAGVSKGKGFAGVVKRHNFKGGPKTHGQSDRLRAPGSIGQTTTPGRVYRGKRMAGHMGTEVVTIKNLKIVDVDAVNKILYVWGLIPGGKNTIVFVHRTGEMNNFIPLHKIATNEAPNQTEEAPQSLSEGEKGESSA